MKRLFIALPLSPRAAREIQEAWSVLRISSRRIRWIPVEHMHITLSFLGDTGEELIPDLLDILDDTGCSFPAVPVKTSGPGYFPAGKNPKILFESLGEGIEEIGKIQKHLSRALSPLVGLEKRKFHPHITMARIKPGTHPSRRVLSLYGSCAGGRPVGLKSFFLSRY